MEEENKDKDLGINDERSIAADSLKELNKLSNHSQQNPIKEDPKKSNSFISMKQKDSKGTASKDDAPKDQLPNDLKPLLAGPDHLLPKHIEDAITEKAHQLQPLIDAQKNITGLHQYTKALEHLMSWNETAKKEETPKLASNTTVTPKDSLMTSSN